VDHPIDIAASKQSEIALQPNDELKEQLLSNSFDFTSLLDENGIRKYVSASVTQMLGFTPEELTGIPIIESRIHPDDLSMVQEAFAKLLGGMPVTIQYRHRHRDGRWIWLEVRAKNQLSDPSVRSIIATTRDITERKQAEDAFMESSARLRSIIDSAPFGAHSYELDSDDRLVFIGYNQSAERILGVSHALFVGKTIAESFPLLARTEIPERYADVAKNGIPFEAEQVDYDEGGIRGAFEVRAVQVGPRRVVAFFRDITERKRAEEALRESERKFKAIFNATFQFVGLLDLNGVLMEVNDSALQFAGIALEDAIHKPLWETRWWSGDNARVRQLKDAIARCTQGEFIRYEVELQGAGNITAIFDFSLKPVFDANGGVAMLVPEARDITDLKKAESLFINAQKLESIGVLAGGIAHDFNNLLGGIYGYIDLAAGEIHNENASTYLAQAMETINRARGLTQQLLTFAKGGAPIKHNGTLAPVIIETAKFVLSGSAISCRFAIPDDLWTCDFDKNQISQVIDNILINAQQAMPEGGTIEISATNTVFEEQTPKRIPSGKFAKIAIKDQGIGMTKEMLPKIFDPFFTTKTKGYGLGLATCYSIVKRHGGFIEVESQPGKGSVFSIFLPTSTESVSIDNGPKKKEHKGQGIFLVMDDEQMIRDVAGKALQSFGYTVVLKENGRDAIDYFAIENKEVAGMLFDLTIPGGIGGKEAIVEIRKISAETPAFVASGYANDPVMADPEKYGFTASICKPFTLSQLADMLNSYMGRNSSPDF
jgi:PAS domain S-box-containing protein